MVFGGGRKQKELETAAERARKEVLFWKDQLDHAVNEKNSLLERYTELYRHSFELEQAVVALSADNTELRHVLDRTVILQDERKAVGGSATPTSESGTSTPDGRQLQHCLANTRAALKQADVRIAILEERNVTLQQESDLLHKQNELLRSSEAAYQKEAQLLREELSNARGINDLTADETTKLLLENSRLQQALVAARSEGLHKDEMLRLLSAEINELNSKLEWYASACQSMGIETSWDGLVPESSSDRLDLLSTALPASLSQGGSAATAAASGTASAIAEEVQAEEQPNVDSVNAAESKKNTSGGARVSGGSAGGGGGAAAEPGSAEAAVEALAAALPLKLSGLGNMLRTSSQDRKGTFSGQPITPRDMAEAKQKLAEQEAKQQSSGTAAAARPPRQTPRSSRGVRPGQVQLPPIPPVPAGGLTALVPSPKSSRGSSRASVLKQQQQQQQQQQANGTAEGLQIEAAEKVVDEDDEGMLQGSPNLAEVQQRALVRHPTPALSLTSTAVGTPSSAPAAVTPSGEREAHQGACPTQVALCEAAAVAAVTAAVRSSLNSLPSSPTKQQQQQQDSPGDNTTSDSSSTPGSPSKMGPLATAVAATAAAKAMLAAGAAAELNATRAVNEFKLAACAAPPVEPVPVGDEAVGAPVELSELEPGIPQRQQALARLAAGQQQPSKSSSSRRLAVAQAESAPHNTAAPSPRTNLAEAMSNPAALVAAAAAAGVLDAPECVPVSEADALVGSSAAGVVVCQRQAALARLAAERESRLLQEQQGGSGGARSRSSSPADASNAANKRRTAATRLGLGEGSDSSGKGSAGGAVSQEATAAASAPSEPASLVGRCSSDVMSHVLTDDVDEFEEGASSGSDAARLDVTPAADEQTAHTDSSAKGSSNTSSTEQKSVNAAAADAAGQQSQIKPGAAADCRKPVASEAADAQSSSQEPAANTSAAQKPAASSDSSVPAAAAADTTAPLPAAAKIKETELPRSNSLKERIAVMNALNLPQPLGSPKINDSRSGGGSSSSSSSDGGASGGSRSGGGGVVARYLQPEQSRQQEQSQGGSSRSGGSTISRIPSGPVSKSKVSAAISKIPSKIPSAPDASAAGVSGGGGGGGMSGGGYGRSRSASPAEQQLAVSGGQQTSRPVSTSSQPEAPAADKVEDKQPAAAANGPSRSSSGDVVVEVSAPARAGVAAPSKTPAASKVTSSTGSVADNDVKSKDASSVHSAVAADTWKPTPPKRQLSDKMAAMRAAFEGK